MKKTVRTPQAPQPAGPYSQGIEMGGFLFTAGFGPQDPVSGTMADNVGDQTRQVLRNIENVLRARGLDLDDVVKVTAHLAHLTEDFAEYNAAYGEFFKDPFPVRTTVGSTLPGILVEIDVVAALRN